MMTSYLGATREWNHISHFNSVDYVKVSVAVIIKHDYIVELDSSYVM